MTNLLNNLLSIMLGAAVYFLPFRCWSHFTYVCVQRVHSLPASFDAVENKNIVSVWHMYSNRDRNHHKHGPIRGPRTFKSIIECPELNNKSMNVRSQPKKFRIFLEGLSSR